MASFLRSSSNASSGMGVADQCKHTFLELQRKKGHRYVIFKIDEKRKEVIVEKTGVVTESYDDFLAALPENDCRYAIYDFDFVTQENCQKSKIFFIAWSPSVSRIRSKMLYAGADPMELFKANIGDSNVVVDLHYYDLFDTFFSNMSVADNIQFIYESRESQLQALNSANGPLIFIGEWVNELNSTNASQLQYQMFGTAQLEVYGAASFGWAYWTLKNDEVHWDFEWNIRNKYLILGSSSKASPARFSLIILTFGAVLLLFFGMML